MTATAKLTLNANRVHLRIRDETDKPLLTLQATRSATLELAVVGVQGPVGSRAVQWVYSITGKPLGGQHLGDYLADDPLELLSDKFRVHCKIAPTANYTFQFQDKNGASVGSATILAGQTTGTVTLTITTMSDGDVLSLYAAGAVDLTLEDPKISIRANRPQ